MADETEKDLRERASALDIDGRSSMNKTELEQAIARAVAAKAAADAAKQEEDAARRLVDERAGLEGDELLAAVEADRLTGQPELKPSTPEQVGRPEAVDAAEQNAADREKHTRVIGTTIDQEG